jgi:hypothetical protein
MADISLSQHTRHLEQDADSLGFVWLAFPNDKRLVQTPKSPSPNTGRMKSRRQRQLDLTLSQSYAEILSEWLPATLQI